MKCNNCNHARDGITKEINDLIKKHTNIIAPGEGKVYCVIFHDYINQRKACKFYKQDKIENYCDEDWLEVEDTK